MRGQKGEGRDDDSQSVLRDTSRSQQLPLLLREEEGRSYLEIDVTPSFDRYYFETDEQREQRLKEKPPARS